MIVIKPLSDLRLAPSTTLLGAALNATFFREAESGRLGVETIKQRSREISHIFGVRLSQGSFVNSIVAVFANAGGQFLQISGQQAILKEPWQAKPQITPNPSVRGPFRILGGQQPFGGQINCRPEHCSSSVPATHRGAYLRLSEYSFNFLRKMFGWGFSEPVFLTHVPFYVEERVECGTRFEGKFPAFKELLKATAFHPHDEGRACQTFSTDRKRFVPPLPMVTYFNLRGRSHIKCYMLCPTTGTISYQFSHFSDLRPAQWDRRFSEGRQVSAGAIRCQLMGVEHL